MFVAAVVDLHVVASILAVVPALAVPAAAAVVDMVVLTLVAEHQQGAALQRVVRSAVVTSRTERSTERNVKDTKSCIK